MKNSLLLFFLLLISQFAYGQSKFDEFEKLIADDESARIDNFLGALEQQPESRGLIVVYVGDNLDQIGNITAYIKGAQYYITEARGIEKDRISFMIGEGKKKFHKELWILPDETKKPQIKSSEIDLNNLKGRILYASSCIECDPVVPALSNDRVNLEEYLKIIKNNPNYQGLITIHPSKGDDTVKEYVKEIKQTLNQKNINKERVRIKLAGKRKNELTRVEFYLISENKK